MTESEWPFGPYLEQWIRDRGLTNRAAADLAGVSETTVRILIRGYTEPRPGTRVRAGTTVPTIAKLSNALGFPLEEGLQLVGLSAPRHLIARHAPVEQLTVDDLFTELRLRYTELRSAAEAITAPLTVDAMRARGLAIVRLDELVAEIREAGDLAGAAQIAALSASMLREVEALEAAQVREAQPENSNGHAE